MKRVMVRIQRDACTGHGRCYALAPGVFDIDDEGKGVAPTGDIAPEAVEFVRRAVDNCPEEAIKLEDVDDV